MHIGVATVYGGKSGVIPVQRNIPKSLMQGNRKFEKTCKRDGKVFQFQRTTRLWTILVTIRSVNPRSVLKRANKTSILKIGMTTDGNHACIPKLGGEFRALLLVLVLLSRPEVWLQSRSRLGIPCRVIWNLSYWTQHAGIMSTTRQSTGNMSLDGVSE